MAARIWLAVGWRGHHVGGMVKIAALADRAVVAVAGEDRVGFLQGLVSNDVTGAVPGRAVWAALLTPQGKWLADFFIHADGERLLLDVEGEQAGMLVQRLARYRLRAKVTLAVVEGMAVFAGWDGPAVEGAVPDPRLAEAGWRYLGDLGATASALEYDLHRLRLGLPDGSRDMEAEKTTLLEAGFDALHGVSWTKGCYMGQELTARTKYRGLLKRRLVPVVVEGGVPAFGTAVFDGETEVGGMRSGQGERGLALMRMEAVRAEALVCGGRRVAVAVPGWWDSV